MKLFHPVAGPVIGSENADRNNHADSGKLRYRTDGRARATADTIKNRIPTATLFVNCQSLCGQRKPDPHSHRPSKRFT
jgi:hypothetical protein